MVENSLGDFRLNVIHVEYPEIECLFLLWTACYLLETGYTGKLCLSHKPMLLLLCFYLSLNVHNELMEEP